MKRSSTSSAIREMKMKTRVRYHYTTELLQLNGWKTLSVDFYIGHLEFSYTVDGSINQYSHFIRLTVFTITDILIPMMLKLHS